MEKTLDQKFREEVQEEIKRRGLTSYMNNTKWMELQAAIENELPFSPPYVRKDLAGPEPRHEFREDVGSWGDWSVETLYPLYTIEWLKIRPRYLKHRGQLISPEVVSCEADLLAILKRYQIPFVSRDGFFMIYGYASDGSWQYDQSPAEVP